MKFLIDECLHTSLVGLAHARGHDCHHVVWLGLAGATDRMLMDRIVAEDFTFVTNNAVDFRRLYAAGVLHAGLVIIVPQVTPSLQRTLFSTLLEGLGPGETIVNEAVEITLDQDRVVLSRYELPAPARFT